MKHWQNLGRGRRAFYLVAILLPLAAIVVHLAMGAFSLYYLSHFGVALLLGLANLLLAARWRLPRRGLGWWHALLVLALLLVLRLLWFEIGVLIWVYSDH